MNRKLVSRGAASAFLVAALFTGHAYAAGSDGVLPAVQHANGVDFVTGGVGLDESTAFKREARHWPLSLEFIGGERNYVSDVAVRITDAKGGTAFEGKSDGPYMLVRLRPGRYTVHVNYDGHEQTKSISVGAKPGAHLRFDWKVR